MKRLNVWLQITKYYFRKNFYSILKYLKLDFNKNFNTRSIALAAVMLALTIVIVKFLGFSLKLGVGGKGTMVIGFGFIPNVLFSFLHGPFFGFILGFISDTTLFILKPTFYSPIMAIQEPIVGVLAGIAGIVYSKLRNCQFDFKKYLLFFTVMQFILVALLILSFYLIFFSDFVYSFSLKNNKVFSVKWDLLYMVISGIFISTLFMAVELVLILILWITWNNQKQNSVTEKFNNALIFIIIIILQLFLTLINSWILSPLHFLVFYDIDYLVSLLPRLVKELLLMPLRIAIYFIIFKTILKIYYDKYFLQKELNSYQENVE